MKPYMQEQNGILYLPHRACDQCRNRKIRCDRQLPCCNCRLAKKSCSFTNVGSRPRQPRTRPGRLGEKRSDNIEDRLGRIEDALLALTQSKCRQSCSASLPAHAASGPVSVGDQSATMDSVHMNWKNGSRNGRGGSSIQAQMNFACRYLQDIIDFNSAPEEENDTLRKALFSLQRLAQNKDTEEDSSIDTIASSVSREPVIRLPHSKPMDENGLRGMPMPPLVEVFSLLRDLHKTRPVTFPMVCVFTSVDLLAEHCRRLYLPVREEDVSFATFLTVNAGLFFLFKEKMALSVHRGDQEAVVRYLALRNTCRDNIETALEHMPLVIPAHYESLLALVLGAGYGIEMSRPWLAWRLNTAACQMCVELGYHQEEEEEGLNEDTPKDGQRSRDAQRILFWFSYIHDRALSLRFGRACFLQDFDITVPRTLSPFSPEFEGHRAIISSWIVLGEVQGRMYRELYSPAAQRCPVSRLVRSARECADILLREVDMVQQQRARLEQRLFTWSDTDEADDHDGYVGDNDKAAMEIEAMLLRVDEVTILSSLTLAYRAIPPYGSNENNEDGENDAEKADKSMNGFVGKAVGNGQRSSGSPTESMLFCDDCIIMARKAMHMHLEYLQRADRNPMLVATHMHWTVLLLPFAPFIVLFCFVMEQANAEDLCYLQRCMESLQPWQKLSEQAGQLFRICQSLFEAAQVHVKCKPHVEVA